MASPVSGSGSMLPDLTGGCLPTNGIALMLREQGTVILEDSVMLISRKPSFSVHSRITQTVFMICPVLILGIPLRINSSCLPMKMLDSQEREVPES